MDLRLNIYRMRRNASRVASLFFARLAVKILIFSLFVSDYDAELRKIT